VQSRVAYTFVPYGRLQQGTREAPNPDGLGIDVHLASMQATGALPTGTSLAVELPVGSLITRTSMGDRTDTGVGDLEVRVRQTVRRWLRVPRLGASVGAVVPTGPYSDRTGAATLQPEAVALTLGRGAPWALAELDAAVPFGDRATAFVQISARTPLAHTRDDFAWGSEARATLGAQLALGAHWSVGALADVQWRGGATEPDPFMPGNRLESASVGGTWLTVTPSVRRALPAGVAVSAGLRFALASDVVGNQLVPQTGAFLAISYAARARPAPPRRVRPAAGAITVIDYWATWCGLCAQIHADLEAARARWPDVRITRVDATAWPDPAAPRLPDGAGGLPAIEIYDARGTRTHLLVGPDARRVVEIVDGLRRRGAAP
jgi:thiol-disulfide isomerase/thioredoxin